MARAFWIAERCRLFGLNVVEVDGWQTRGKEPFAPHGVVCHHTVGPASGDMPTLRVLINGRSDLPGPLCNVGLGRSGTVYVIASGRANHAGTGGWRGLSGNSSVFGIEAENTGSEPWPEQQINAYHLLAAALISGKDVGSDVNRVCAHKEWAPHRKIDPHSFDMAAFRNSVKKVVDRFAAPSSAAPATTQPAPRRTGTPIIGRPAIAPETAKAWAAKKKATVEFQELADLYWRADLNHGRVRPEVAYAQAAKETGFGHFGGVIDKSFHNPCGLKTADGGDDSDPEAHHRFPTWRAGVEAHFDHLALYAGAKGYPRKPTPDPRHFQHIKGKAGDSVEALGGSWAPAKDYGTSIVRSLLTPMLNTKS